MFIEQNVHPQGKIVGDCVKRAITKAAMMDYNEVKRELNRYKKISKAKAFNDIKNCEGYVENVLKAKKIGFPATAGKPRMNGVRFMDSHPVGRYILRMAKHWTACVDGDIYDTWDCTEKCVYKAWKLG